MEVQINNISRKKALHYLTVVYYEKSEIVL